MTKKELLALWLAPTCSSFTMARRGKGIRLLANGRRKGGYPAPLRSNEHVRGLPGLSKRDLEKANCCHDGLDLFLKICFLLRWHVQVLTGNALADFSIEMIELGLETGTPVFLENPQRSFLWKYPGLVQLLHLGSQFRSARTGGT